jgi:hypothetical protein
MICESVLVSDIKSNLDSVGMCEEFTSWWLDRLHELTTDKIVNVRI